MIKKIDKYIVYKYLSTFFFTVLLISVFAIVMDFAERINHFVGVEEPTVNQIIFDYYLPFIPWINGLMWPLFALLAVIFFTSRMASNSEIISILSAGVSYNRLLVPYMFSAGLLAIILWIGNNYVIPNSTRIKNEFSAQYIKKSELKTHSNNLNFFLNPDEKAYIRFFKSKDTSVHTFRLERFQRGKLVEVLKAKKLTFKNEPNEWTMHDYERHKFDGIDESLVLYIGEKKDTVFNFVPDDFVYYSKEMEMMTTTDLKNYINTERSRGIDAARKYEVELYRRTSDPFTIIILTLIGVAIASRKTRGGMGLHLALGVVIGSAYVILAKFSATFVNNLNLSPSIGVWVPNIIFFVVALVLINRAQK